MKYLINFSLILVLLFSCAKEELLPIEKTDRVSPRTALEEVSATSDYAAVTEKLLFEFETLDDALQSVKFDERPEWIVDIKAYTCSRGGETLIAYNPASAHQLNFYDSRRFDVYWFKGNRPIVRNVDYKLECVCQGTFTAVVINRRTQAGVGLASYTAKACPASLEVTKSPDEI